MVWVYPVINYYNYMKRIIYADVLMHIGMCVGIGIGIGLGIAFSMLYLGCLQICSYLIRSL